MAITQSDTEVLIEAFMNSSWDELQLQFDGDELILSRDGHIEVPALPIPSAISTLPPVARTGPVFTDTVTKSPILDKLNTPSRNWIAVKAPNLGTAYTAPKPDADPYVTIGTRVTPDTEVCLIEVMKLFTAVRAGISGIVREIAITDGQMVEFDQPLIWIEQS